VRIPLKRPPLAALVAIVLVIVADQVAKAFVVTNADRLPASVLGPVKLEIVHNTGVSFSLFPGRTGFTIALVSLVIAVVAVLLFTLPRPYAVPISLILAGSIANLIDRVRWGYVIDYVAIWHWPRFNVADFAIVLGAVLVVLVALVQTARPPAPSSGPAGGEDGAGPPTASPSHAAPPEMPPPASPSEPPAADGGDPAEKDA
jgi:signal peptidase II